MVNVAAPTTTLGEKAMHAGGFIIPKDKKAGVEGDLTLIADFKLSDLKRR